MSELRIPAPGPGSDTHPVRKRHCQACIHFGRAWPAGAKKSGCPCFEERERGLGAIVSPELSRSYVRPNPGHRKGGP